jgi:hypothetical protein
MLLYLCVERVLQVSFVNWNRDAAMSPTFLYIFVFSLWLEFILPCWFCGIRKDNLLLFELSFCILLIIINTLLWYSELLHTRSAQSVYWIWRKSLHWQARLVDMSNHVTSHDYKLWYVHKPWSQVYLCVQPYLHVPSSCGPYSAPVLSISVPAIGAAIGFG